LPFFPLLNTKNYQMDSQMISNVIKRKPNRMKLNEIHQIIPNFSAKTLRKIRVNSIRSIRVNSSGRTWVCWRQCLVKRYCGEFSESRWQQGTQLQIKVKKRDNANVIAIFFPNNWFPLLNETAHCLTEIKESVQAVALII
jgi:hypothetical protein